MTRKQIRRAVNIYMAALLNFCERDFPDWMTEKDKETFRAEAEDRVNEILERVRCPIIPLTLESCLKTARDEVKDR